MFRPLSGVSCSALTETLPFNFSHRRLKDSCLASLHTDEGEAVVGLQSSSRYLCLSASSRFTISETRTTVVDTCLILVNMMSQ